MSLLGAIAVAVLPKIISGVFGTKASKTEASAIRAGADVQARTALELQEKELETTREALAMMKESETRSINMMVDSLLNQFRMGKQDYLIAQKARAGLEALTYGKPAKYIQDITMKMQTTLKPEGIDIPAPEGLKRPTTGYEIAPPREDLPEREAPLTLEQKARREEGYRETVLPAVGTETGYMRPEEMTKQIYESPQYKRRRFEIEEAMKGLMGRELESSAGRKLFMREQERMNIEEENRMWNKLSHLAGYGTYLPEAVGTTGARAGEAVYGGGIRGAETIISGARSQSALGRWGAQAETAGIVGAGKSRADIYRTWGSQIGYALEDVERQRMLSEMVKPKGRA